MPNSSPQSLHQFTFRPTNRGWGYLFPHTLTSTCDVRPFEFHPSDGWKMALQCGFNVHFSYSEWGWDIFTCFRALCIYSIFPLGCWSSIINFFKYILKSIILWWLADISPSLFWSFDIVFFNCFSHTQIFSFYLVESIVKAFFDGFWVPPPTKITPQIPQGFF